MCSLIILLLFKLSFAVRIEKLVVPEVVQSGNAVVLDCRYADVGDKLIVQWLFNASQVVYEWRHGSELTVQGILDGQLELTYKVSSDSIEKHKAIRISSAEPEMTGDYTCRVQDGNQEARLTKTMLVFSPEKDFSLIVHRRNSTEVRCAARGLYPQPELTIERNGVTYQRQQQRVWRFEGALYDAETTASLSKNHLQDSIGTVEHVTCRLQLPQAGYTAMKRETVCLEDICKSKTSKKLFGAEISLIMAALTIKLTGHRN